MLAISGAMAKLQVTNTGDTLCDQANQIVYPKIEFPAPVHFQGHFSRPNRARKIRLFSGLAKLQEEDPSISVEKNTETGETLVSAQGDLHTWTWSKTSLRPNSARVLKCMIPAYRIAKPSRKP